MFIATAPWFWFLRDQDEGEIRSIRAVVRT